MSRNLTTFHLSSLSLWNLGKGKGRVSIILPLERLISKGHSVFYLSHNRKQKFGNVNGIKVKKVYAPKSLNIRRLSLISKLIFLPISIVSYLIRGLALSKDKKPDIIFSHTCDTAIQGFLLSKLLNTKFVIKLYGVAISPNSSIIQKILRFDLIFSFISNADLYILTNDGTSADKLAKYYGVDDNKIHFLKNGIDKKWADYELDIKLKNKIAPNNEHIILSVSRLVSWKQVDLIIKQMPGLLRLNENVRLVIVGDGLEKENLMALTESKGIQDYVMFVGAIDQKEIVKYMKASDLFISMNNLSSMSNPVFEAMICGKTVIALNKGSTKDLIKHNYNGILVEQKEIVYLSKLINDLLNNPTELERIGINAQNYIDKNFQSWEERTNHELNVIERLFNSK